MSRHHFSHRGVLRSAINESGAMSDTGQTDEEKIRIRAYLLWEMEGRQEGLDDEYWHRARDLIEAEKQSSYPPAQSRGHRK